VAHDLEPEDGKIGPVPTPDRSADGASLRDPGFADDTGAVPPEVAAALVAYATDPSRYAAALGAIQASRLLLPVVEVTGDHGTDMAAVLIQGADGRRALVAFTGLEPLYRWNPKARPIPVACRVAAESAQHEGAAALLVDVAGPTTLVVEGEDLVALAEGWTLAVVGDRTAWIRPAPE
jgi:hypothetical protein